MPKLSSLLPSVEWQDLLFLLSIDAVFLWSCILGLGDYGFKFVDPYFLVQLQFKVFGLIVLAWAIASIAANSVRFLIRRKRALFIRKLRIRRIYRLFFKRYVAEIVLCVLIVSYALLGSSFLKICFLALIVLIFSKLVSFLSKKFPLPLFKTKTEQRIKNKRLAEKDYISGQYKTIAVLNHSLTEIEEKLGLIKRTAII